MIQVNEVFECKSQIITMTLWLLLIKLLVFQFIMLWFVLLLELSIKLI